MKKMQDIIDQYLNKEMSESERRAFEQKMEADTALKEAVEEKERLVRGIRSKGTQDIRQMLNSVQKEYEAEAKPDPKIRQLRTGLAIAASVAVLIIAGLFFFNKSAKVDETVVENPVNQEEVEPIAEIDKNTSVQTDEEVAGIPQSVKQFKIDRLEKKLQITDVAWEKTGRQLDVVIYQHGLPTELYLLKSDQLSIYTTQPELFGDANLNLLELSDENSAFLYLKRDDVYFAVKAGSSSREPLIQLTETSLIEVLK